MVIVEQHVERGHSNSRSHTKIGFFDPSFTFFPMSFFVIFSPSCRKKWYRKVLSESHHLFGCTLSPCVSFVTFLSTTIAPFLSDVFFSGSNAICVSSFFAVWLEIFNCRVDCRDRVALQKWYSSLNFTRKHLCQCLFLIQF